MRNIKGWIGLLFFLAVPFSVAAPEIDASFSEQKQSYLSRVNSELNFWDEIVHRELRSVELERDVSDRGKILQDLELQIRDLRGELTKLEPIGRDLWRGTHPELESQLAQLRQGFRDVR